MIPRYMTKVDRGLPLPREYVRACTANFHDAGLNSLSIDSSEIWIHTRASQCRIIPHLHRDSDKQTEKGELGRLQETPVSRCVSLLRLARLRNSMRVSSQAGAYFNVMKGESLCFIQKSIL